MTPAERELARIERWRDRVQLERDHHARVLASERESDVQRAFAHTRLERLDVELAEVDRFIQEQRARLLVPLFMFVDRPRPMLKVPLRRRKAATRRSA